MSGIDTQPFYLDQDEIDPHHGAHSLFDFTFDQSYGDTQEVRVLAKRSLTNVKLVYRINGGDKIKVATQEWNGGERYGPGAGTHYHVVAGNVPGTTVGDQVEVWFEGGGAKSASFTYDVVSDSGNDLLVVAAEDYTGASPVYADQSGPNSPLSSTPMPSPPTASHSTCTTSTPTGGPRRTTSAS